MFGLSRVDAETSIWFLLGLHLVLSIGLACIFTPAFTTALNPLPSQLYSHGSAILTTLQQVAGAAGTALLVTIMAARTVTLTGRGQPALVAQNHGIQTAFLVAGITSLIAVLVAARLSNPKPSGDTSGDGSGPVAAEAGSAPAEPTPAG